MNPAYKKASFLERLAAFIIDVIILAILQLALTLVLKSFNFHYKIFDLILISLYDVLFIWIAGATPGKMLLKLRVVNTSYKRVNFGQAFLRETIGRFISGIIFTIGYLWMLIDKKNQTWHDKIANTVVVRLDRKGNLIPSGASETISKSRKLILWLIILLNPLSLVTYWLIIYIFFFRPYKMSNESMQPTLREEQYLATSVIEMRLYPPQRGDIIVFKSPEDPKKSYIRRVIGIPGDEILLQEGKVYLNGQVLHEDYLLDILKEYTHGGAFLQANQEITVPADHYFVLEDFRMEINDSRKWGFVPRKNIISKVMFCYWNCKGKRDLSKFSKPQSTPGAATVQYSLTPTP